ncbi:hypothetical protein SPH9361_03062 [Sphingobium sp. CECT 9361]|nr:hypothetical protein SPH9361_03062 [Sphingobium sp. CECT 9361]
MAFNVPFVVQTIIVSGPLSGGQINIRKAVISIAAASLAVSVVPATAGETVARETPPKLLPLQPIIVPIINSDRIEGALHVSVVMSAASDVALAGLTEREPKLRAALVAELIEFSRLYVSTQMPVNAAQLRTLLTNASRAQDKDVADVLIVEISAMA